MPEMSIIVPVYKTEKYLHRCVDSILAQTFTNFECILIDDGSPDNCPAICDEYAAKDSRIRVIHQKNAGVSAARNAGLDAARGEYIGFVDSDDWVDRNTYEEAVTYCKRKKADLVCFGLYKQKSKKNIRIKITSSGDFTTDFYKYPVYMHSVCNKIIRLKLLNEQQLRFDTSLDVCEDQLFVFKLFLSTTNICHLDKCLYFYEENSSSATRTEITNKKVSDTYKVYETQVDCYNSIHVSSYNHVRSYLSYRNAIAVLPYLTQLKVFDIQKFRGLSLPFNIWVYSFRLDLFLITLAAFLHIDLIPLIYIKMKRFLLLLRK